MNSQLSSWPEKLPFYHTEIVFLSLSVKLAFRKRKNTRCCPESWQVASWQNIFLQTCAGPLNLDLKLSTGMKMCFCCWAESASSTGSSCTHTEWVKESEYIQQPFSLTSEYVDREFVIATGVCRNCSILLHSFHSSIREFFQLCIFWNWF